MTKAILKYLLTLCILLLSVYSHLYAHAYQELPCHSHTQRFKGAVHASLGTSHNDQGFNPRYSLSDSEKSFRLEATDIEEEDYGFVAFRKYLESNYYFTAVFYAIALAFFFRYIKTSLLFCKHFSYTLSKRRYLLFQVFII